MATTIMCFNFKPTEGEQCSLFVQWSSSTWTLELYLLLLADQYLPSEPLEQMKYSDEK